MSQKMQDTRAHALDTYLSARSFFTLMDSVYFPIKGFILSDSLLKDTYAHARKEISSWTL